MINNGQGTAVRTAGETRAVKMAFFSPRIADVRGGGAEKDVLTPYMVLQKLE